MLTGADSVKMSSHLFLVAGELLQGSGKLKHSGGEQIGVVV